MRTSPVLALFIGLTAISLVVACGDDDDDDATEEATEAEATEAAGDTPVRVEATEFEFALDGEFSPGDTGFTWTNRGEQGHEARVFAISQFADVDELLESEIDEGEITVHAEGLSLGPGGEGSVAFVAPLLPGRYLMLCFVTDEETGEEHAQLGMVEEFTVEES